MYNHAPLNYSCPICIGLEESGSKDTLIVKDDILYKDAKVTALINSFFIGNNPGHVIVVPNAHYENIYDIPSDISHHIIDIGQKMALVLKQAYQCKGVTLLQNNEPAGNQHAFHFHLHVFPRYPNDNLHQYMDKKRLASPEERKQYSDKLKQISMLE